MCGRVQKLPNTVISSASNTYKKRKRLGIRELPIGRLKMVIFIYLNILLNVSMINIANTRVFAAENGHLDCLKYLHETAKAPWDEEAVQRKRTTTSTVYNTSSTITVLIHPIGDTKAERCTCSTTRKKKKKNSSPDGAYARARKESVLLFSRSLHKKERHVKYKHAHTCDKHNKRVHINCNMHS